MIMSRPAAYIGVEAFNAVDEAVFLPEIYRPIGGRRFRIVHDAAKAFEDFIGAEGFTAARYDFQDLQTGLGQAVLVGRAVFLRILQCGLCHGRCFPASGIIPYFRTLAAIVKDAKRMVGAEEESHIKKKTFGHGPFPGRA